MPAARLNEIVDALEMQFDESSSFLDRDTGHVETVSHVLLRTAEESRDDEEPDLPTWQKQEWEIAKRIVSTDHFQKLPTKFDVHGWSIMQDFSRSVESDRIREDLLHAIHGAGAFRNFKETLRRHRIESAWFAFRAEALRQIALNWCEEKGGTWSRDGVILLDSSNALMCVSAEGGELKLVHELDKSRKELALGWPHFLPDARHFLYSSASADAAKSGIYAGSLDTKEPTC